MAAGSSQTKRAGPIVGGVQQIVELRNSVCRHAFRLHVDPEIRPGVPKRPEDAFQTNRFVGSVAQPKFDRINFYFVVASQVGTTIDKPADRLAAPVDAEHVSASRDRFHLARQE